MNTRVNFFGKIIFSQILAFIISAYLVRNVFIGATPIVQISFQQRLKTFPQRSVVFLSKTPQLFIEKYNKLTEVIISGIKFDIPSSSPTTSVTPTLGMITITDQPSQQPTDIIASPTQTQISLPRPTITSTQISIPTGIYFPLPTTKIVPTQQPTIITYPTSIPTLRPTEKIVEPTTCTACQMNNNSQLEKQIIDLINNKRKAQGLKILTTNSALTRAARVQSQDNVSNHQCDHYGKDGSDTWKRVKNAGYTGNVYGEVVACGSSSPQIAVDGWWSSPPHHDVLTFSGGTKIGVGWINNYQTAIVGY